MLVDNFCINWEEIFYGDLKRIANFSCPKFQGPIFDYEMINIMKFDGKLVVGWENIKTFLPISSQHNYIQRCLSFTEDFLARDRLCVLTNTDIKEESLLEDHAGVLITPRFRGVQIFR